METKVLTKEFLAENRDVMMKFVDWFKATNKDTINVPIWVDNKQSKQVYTQVTIQTFFDLDFTLQVGYYIEWLNSNGVYIVHESDVLNHNELMLKLMYTNDVNMDFKYFDMENVYMSHFKGNPLECYEVLIAMFITKLNFPF